jgi:hypothetical protein
MHSADDILAAQSLPRQPGRLTAVSPFIETRAQSDLDDSAHAEGTVIRGHPRTGRPTAVPSTAASARQGMANGNGLTLGDGAENSGAIPDGRNRPSLHSPHAGVNGSLRVAFQGDSVGDTEEDELHWPPLYMDLRPFMDRAPTTVRQARAVAADITCLPACIPSCS